MHSIRLFRSRKLAIILVAAISAFTFVSVGHLSSNPLMSTKLHRRDGSTITFSLPWKSIISHTTDPTLKPASSALTNYLNGIKNVAEALQRGGIGIGDTLADPNPNNPSDVLEGAVGSAPSNTTNAIVGQATGVLRELVSVGSSLVNQALSTATSASNVGAINTTLPTNPSFSDTLNWPCDCQPQVLHPSTSFGNESANLVITSAAKLPTSSIASRTMASFPCPAPTTVICTETWHSTHYVEAAVLFGFLSVITITETAGPCPSHSHLESHGSIAYPRPEGLAQRANGTFVNYQRECSPIMNGSPAPCPAPNSEFPPSHPCLKDRQPFVECSNGWFCPPQHTAIQTCPPGYGWAFVDCQCGWYCPAQPISSPQSTMSGLLFPNLSNTPWPSSMPKPSLPSHGQDFVVSTVFNNSSSSLRIALSRNMTMPIPDLGQIANSTSSFLAASSSGLSPAPVLIKTTGFEANKPSQATPPITVLSPPTILPQVTILPVIVDYGSRVLQGTESGVSGALASLNGLSGSLLSPVIEKVNSVLAAALTTAAPVPSQVDDALTSGLRKLTTSRLAASNPVNPSQPGANLIETAADGIASVVSSVIPTATSLIGNFALSNTLVDAAGLGGAKPPALLVATDLIGDILPTASAVFNNLPTIAAERSSTTASSIVPIAYSIVGNFVPIATPTISRIPVMVRGGVAPIEVAVAQSFTSFVGGALPAAS